MCVCVCVCVFGPRWVHIRILSTVSVCWGTEEGRGANVTYSYKRLKTHERSGRCVGLWRSAIIHCIIALLADEVEECFRALIESWRSFVDEGDNNASCRVFVKAVGTSLAALSVLKCAAVCDAQSNLLIKYLVDNSRALLTNS